MALSTSTPYTDVGLDKGSREAWVDNFVNMYEIHSKEGVCSTVTINATGKADMRSKLLSIDTYANGQQVLAEALTDFWAAEVTPNPPHVSVSNNASGKVAAFKTALNSSVLINVANKSISEFLKKTDEVVKTIDYIGQKPVSGGTIPVTDNVS